MTAPTVINRATSLALRPGVRHTLALPVHRDSRGYLARAAGSTAALTCAEVVLSTRPGEVEMQPEFGSRLPALVFEPADAALRREMIDESAGAIARWEPRLTIENASARIGPDGRSASATVTMRLRGTDTRETVALPFQR